VRDLRLRLEALRSQLEAKGKELEAKQSSLRLIAATMEMALLPKEVAPGAEEAKQRREGAGLEGPSSARAGGAQRDESMAQDGPQVQASEAL
jgi:hypothetical protein